MKHIFIFLKTLLTLVSAYASLYAQSCNNLNLQFQSDIPSTCASLTMTMRPDALNRPFLYVAQKEGGLQIYNISDLQQPMLAQSLPVTLFHSLDVMNIYQDGFYLYVALGNIFNKSQPAGMAIVDISDPTAAMIKDVWQLDADSGGGAAIVKVEGNYAYLGAMQQGLIVLDISEKENITFVSQFIPDINYPTSNPNPDLYNARGMAVKDDLVYLCYDAGGLRIINTINKEHPVEVGRFSNPALNGHPRAYNNLVLDHNLVYVAVDYCGVEVLDVVDLQHVTLKSWWNPWHCETNPLNWFSSPGHANEIEYDTTCKLLFISTGKSDLHVVNIANPEQPDSCSVFGGVGNDIGTWGVGLAPGKVFLSYICAVIPFSSNWTGVKILTYNTCNTTAIPTQQRTSIAIFPIPAAQQVMIQCNNFESPITTLQVLNAAGQVFTLSVQSNNQNQLIFNITNLPSGMYFFHLPAKGGLLYGKFIKV